MLSILLVVYKRHTKITTSPLIQILRIQVNALIQLFNALLPILHACVGVEEEAGLDVDGEHRELLRGQVGSVGSVLLEALQSGSALFLTAQVNPVLHRRVQLTESGHHLLPL